MLEKPDLQDEAIAQGLHGAFGLRVSQLTFLPLGADQHTAVYRAVAIDGTPYFAKLRGGVFDPTSVALPRFLSEQGIAPIIAPLVTRTGSLWADLGAYKLILYPYVEGQTADEREMSERHWRQLGAALKRIHSLDVPPALRASIRRETYSARWRQSARAFLDGGQAGWADDPVALAAARLLKDRRDEIADLVARAERLAGVLRARRPATVLCHSDIHASNVLIESEDTLYLIDWDDPILAPKERDLMYFGGGQRFAGHTPGEEEARFYQGYGPAEVDPVALAYYRYERIVVDIAIYCEQLLLTDGGGQDREQSFRYLASNFDPAGTLAIAYASDRTGYWPRDGKS